MLSVKDLAILFRIRRGAVDAVRGVSFELEKGEILGIVGEGGSGKAVTSCALMRILAAGGTIKAGEATCSGLNLRRAAERDMRGREISSIFQNPPAALNPIRKVGHQIEDVLRQQGRATAHNAHERAVGALEAVRINDADSRYDAYPFELSGGMCQRIVCATEPACDPRLLIADEPTTGLDITTQKAVMELVWDLIRERDMSSMLITHDLGLAAQYCDRIMVMKDGEIVEQGDPVGIFSDPRRAYTRKLVDATPRAGESIRSLLPPEEWREVIAHSVADRPVLEVRNLTKTYQGKSGPVHAVRGISFTVMEGQSVGLVGESGCRKSTTSETIVRLSDPTSGEIVFDGQDISKIPARDFARDPHLADIQMVFQDATDSLNPRHTARQTIAEPLRRLAGARGGPLAVRIEEVATLVGLPLSLLDRFPHQLSGGQKARVGIARAIAPEPKFLILDEPTAALDVSIQAVAPNLSVDLRAKLGMSYLFVSHDLHVVHLLCDHVIVMKDGEIVEQGSAQDVMTRPNDDYTKALLAAAPKPPARRRDAPLMEKTDAC